jgi:hypothetical protein
MTELFRVVMLMALPAKGPAVGPVPAVKKGESWMHKV